MNGEPRAQGGLRRTSRALCLAPLGKGEIIPPGALERPAVRGEGAAAGRRRGVGSQGETGCQDESGSKVLVDAAARAVAGPKFFSKTCPS